MSDTELHKNPSRHLPLSRSPPTTSGINRGDEYDTLVRRRNESVESGIGLTNEASVDDFVGCGDDGNDNKASYKINDAYTSLSNVYQPPQSINHQDAYEDLEQYEKMASSSQKNERKDVRSSLTAFQAQRFINRDDGTMQMTNQQASPLIAMHNMSQQPRNQQHHQQRQQESHNYCYAGIDEYRNPLYSSTEDTSNGTTAADDRFKVSCNIPYTTPSSGYSSAAPPASAGSHKKKNVFYESTTTTELQRSRIDRGPKSKISITKQNSTSTLTVCREHGSGKRRSNCCGITQRQCLVALNVVFGVCAIVALTIGIFLVIHQHEQDDDASDRKLSKEGKSSGTNANGMDKDAINRLLVSVQNVLSKIDKLDKNIKSMNHTVEKVASKVSTTSIGKHSATVFFKGCVCQSKLNVTSQCLHSVSSLEVVGVASTNTMILGASCDGTATSTQLNTTINKASCICTGFNIKSSSSTTSSRSEQCILNYWLCPK